jgi:tetratricopeptide (TPR) repeat protein
MAETPEEPESGAEETLESANPAAIAVALGSALGAGKAKGKDAPALAPEAADFLRRQSSLTDLQQEHLHEQFRHLRLRFLGERLRLTLQLMTIAVGVLIFIAIATLTIGAMNDRSLVVEAFHAPPDFTARGEDGQVLAAEVMDRLSAMDAASQSGRASSTYASGWKGEAKVEIPDTGVSVGELRRFLTEWLGHQTRITGEVVKTAAGLRVSVRSNDDAGFSVEGPEADLPKLLDQAAEHLYGATQPYQYSKWLEYHGRAADALVVARELALKGPTAEEKAWAYTQIDNLMNYAGDPAAGAVAGERAVALKPDLILGYINLAASHLMLSHRESAMNAHLRVLELFKTKDSQFGENQRRIFRMANTAGGRFQYGDLVTEVALLRQLRTSADVQGIVNMSVAIESSVLAVNHDASGSRRVRAGLANPDVDLDRHRNFAAWAADMSPQYWEAMEVGDWAGAIADMRRSIAAADTEGRSGALLKTTYLLAHLAWAQTQAGDVAGAQAVIATTPMDCDFCLQTRGRIASRARDFAGADRDFAALTRRADASPWAWEAWGRSLLERGDARAAAAKAETAVDRGPRFADAYELWGEALLAEGDAEGAAEKFEAAAKDAPRWGHNRVMWAAALQKSGDANGAHRQRIYARGMDLTPADRTAAK